MENFPLWLNRSAKKILNPSVKNILKNVFPGTRNLSSANGRSASSADGIFCAAYEKIDPHDFLPQIRFFPPQIPLAYTAGIPILLRLFSRQIALQISWQIALPIRLWSRGVGTLVPRNSGEYSAGSFPLVQRFRRVGPPCKSIAQSRSLGEKTPMQPVFLFLVFLLLSWIDPPELYGGNAPQTPVAASPVSTNTNSEVFQAEILPSLPARGYNRTENLPPPPTSGYDHIGKVKILPPPYRLSVLSGIADTNSSIGKLPDDPYTLSPQEGGDPLRNFPDFNPWRPVEPGSVRSPQLELAAREADLHCRRGFELAGKRAYFAARAEFFKALRLLAQALDHERPEAADLSHSRALTRALEALYEVEDFAQHNFDGEDSSNLITIARGHRTPILRQVLLHGSDAHGSSLTPLGAQQIYLQFAQEQLAKASGGELAASMALYGLGKLYRTLAEQGAHQVRLPGAKAVAFYQAAILAVPTHYLAWHELGVLLARGGRPQEAACCLERCVAIFPNPVAWRNLAWLYRWTAKPDMAVYADIQALAADSADRRPGTGPKSGELPDLLWVPAAWFAGSGESSDGLSEPVEPALFFKRAESSLEYPDRASFVTPAGVKSAVAAPTVATPTGVTSAAVTSADATPGYVTPAYVAPVDLTRSDLKPSESSMERGGYWSQVAATSRGTTPLVRNLSAPEKQTSPYKTSSADYSGGIFPGSSRGAAGSTLRATSASFRNPLPGGNTETASGRVNEAETSQFEAGQNSSPTLGRSIDWSGRGGWEALRAAFWDAYAHGVYVAQPRLAHVPEYRLRVDDQLEIIYRLTRDQTSRPYRLNVGDEVRIESVADKELNRDLLIQPDGTITLRLLGQVRATGLTVSQLAERLEELYRKYYKQPGITVTPLRVNAKLEDLRAAVDSRYGAGGQSRRAVVTPEGTISLPVIGTVPAQGLTLPELQAELNERYRAEIEGIEAIPVLVQRAPRYIYVVGEVARPGRFELTGPTTVFQALAMAGSFNVGANLRQVIIFRRTEDWRLVATVVDIRDPLYGHTCTTGGEIWLADSDVVIVPKGRLLATDDFIHLVFTRGIYGILPLQTSVNFSKMSSL